MEPSELSNRQAVPVVKEELELSKKGATTGRVRVSTRTDTFEDVARASLEGVTVEVTRMPVGRQVETALEVQTQDGVTIIPVLEEILVVEKRLVLKEEIHIRCTVTHETIEVPVALRKQRAIIERLEPEARGPAREWKPTDGEPT
jgi:stress response protein YsnF